MNFVNPPFRDTHLNIFDSPASHFFISDAIVDFETGLIYKDGSILWETANENIIWYDGWCTGDARWKAPITRQELIIERMKKMTTYMEEKILKTENITTYDEDTALHLLHPFNRYVYGHIYDTFQKLYVVEKENLTFDSVLLSSGREVVDFDYHLKILNLDSHNIIDNNFGLIKIKRLLFVLPVVHPTTFSYESYLYIRNKYRNYFDINPKSGPNKKIFLTRRPGEVKRSLLNDKDVELALTAKGITYLDGSQSLKKIVEHFGCASHVAGVHGALFVNNIFGHERTKYLEYCPDNRPVANFLNQYKLCESYQYVLTHADSNQSVELDIEALLQFYAS